MNEKSRYRITGAVFIIALAVIFLPMLFDGEGLQPPQPVAMEKFDVEEISLEAIPKDRIVAAEKLRKRIDSDGYNRTTGILMGDPQLLLPVDATPENGSGWGVQVGSFNSEENAKALRDKLLAEDFHAVLSHRRLHDEILTRVAVGPFIEEAEARKIQKELSSRYDVQAILVRFGY